jgi:hypothetical protein
MTFEEEYMELINTWDALGYHLFMRDLTEDQINDLPDFPKGKIVKYKDLVRALDKAGCLIKQNLEFELTGLISIEDNYGIKEFLDFDRSAVFLNDCSKQVIDYVEKNIWTTEF